jgi:hypothetical protein
MRSLKAAKAQLLLQVEAVAVLQVEAVEVVVVRQAALQEAPLAASQVWLRACHSQECRPRSPKPLSTIAKGERKKSSSRVLDPSSRIKTIYLIATLTGSRTSSNE